MFPVDFLSALLNYRVTRRVFLESVIFTKSKDTKEVESTKVIMAGFI